MTFSIALASKNQDELEAIKTALGTVLMADISQTESIIPTPVTPQGRHKLLELAHKRAEYALRKSEKPDLIIGMATGIAQVDFISGLGDVMYFELTAVVGIYSPENLLPVLSQTIKLPHEVVEHAMDKPGGLDRNSIGQSMFELNLTDNPDDPYDDELRISRVTGIANAVEAIFLQVDFGNSIAHV